MQLSITWPRRLDFLCEDLDIRFDKHPPGVNVQFRFRGFHPECPAIRSIPVRVPQRMFWVSPSEPAPCKALEYTPPGLFRWPVQLVNGGNVGEFPCSCGHATDCPDRSPSRLHSAQFRLGFFQEKAPLVQGIEAKQISEMKHRFRI